MYRDFFGISTSPFEDRADTKFLFTTPEIEEVLASMEYETRHGSGVLLVLGEPGTGKTLLARAFIGRIPVTDHAVVLTCPTTGEIDFLREACKGFGVSLPSTQDQGRRMNRLRRHLDRFQRSGQRGIVIVDQAENLSASNLWELASLLDLYGDSGRLLSVLILAAPSIRKHLERPEFTRLRQHLFGQRKLEALTREQAANYITHRVQVAGAADPHLFETGAIHLIHELSFGVPRLINRLCNASLVAAYAEQRKRISHEIVEEASGQKAIVSSPVSKFRATISPGSDAERGGAGMAACASELDDISFNEPSPFTATKMASSGSSRPHTSDEMLRIDPDSIGATLVDSADPAGLPHGATPPQQTAFYEPSKSAGIVDSSTIERLDRAVARAERMSETTEASIDKAAAIEKHLSSLLDRAERIADSLRAAAQSNAESLIRAEKKIDSLLADTEQRSSAIHKQLANASMTASTNHSTLERLQSSCSAAEQINNRLTAGAREFADRAGELQSQIALLVGAVNGAQESQKSLDAATIAATSRMEREIGEHEQRAEQVTDSARQQIEKAKQEIESCSVRAEQVQLDLQQRVASITEDGIAATHQHQIKLESAIKKALAAMTEIEEKETKFLEHTLDAHRDSAREIDSLAAKRLVVVKNQIHKVFSEVECKTARAFDAALNAHRRSLVELEDAAAHRLESVRESMNTLESRATELCDKADAVSRRMVQARADADNLVEQTTLVDQRLQDRRLQLASLESPLQEVLKKAESNLDALRSSTLQAQSMQQQAAGTLIDVGMACERVRNAREDIEETEIFANEFVAQLADSQKQVQTLRETTTSADAAIARMAAGIAHAQTVTDVVAASTAKLEAAGKRANEDGERLTIQLTPARQIAAGLTESTRGGQTLLELLDKAVVEAGENAARIATSQTAAEEVLNRLTNANVTASSDLAGMQSLEASFSTTATEANRKLEHLIQVGNELVTRQEPHLAAATRGAEIYEELQVMIEPTRRLIVELNEHTEQSRLQHERLDHALGQSSRASEQLSAVSRLLVETREAGENIRKTLEHAKSVHDSTETIVTESSARITALQEAIAAADTIVARHEELTARGAALEGNLSDRISAADAGDRLLTEFVTQIDELSRHLKQIQRQTTEVESKVDELTSRPAAILQSAQAQSAELEKVCTAVRKVFAGLSKAGLDSRHQITELRSVNSEAASLVRQLTFASNRFSPSTQSDSSAILRSGPRANLVNDIEQPKRASEIEPSTIARPLTPRAQEIARLLEEAKRAEDAATSTMPETAGAY
ncbi:MAG: AAA family ATPase [Planctomycetes bacterium]|nr:AAA family ATPase [Planctomycetota bacterium]